MEQQRDEGFGLTEVMVAMIVLALVMVAMLSIVVQGLASTARNATYATASELVQQRLEQAREISIGTDTSRCADMLASVAAVGPAVDDGRGVMITVAGTMTGTCDTTVDSIVAVTVTATTTTPGLVSPLAETTTNIYVKASPS
ncbi:type IV pilus modification PilV family protein [Demequina lignilytica]|uniref:type IV pilus modification PilV family protein n=1 Tax=Demequina lignilytica TaxID=3051663 RepID=UPI00345EB274